MPRAKMQYCLSNPDFTPDVIGEPLTNRNFSYIFLHQMALAGVELTTFGLRGMTATVRPRDEDKHQMQY
jgi:hypothetical protein